MKLALIITAALLTSCASVSPYPPTGHITHDEAQQRTVSVFTPISSVMKGQPDGLYFYSCYWGYWFVSVSGGKVTLYGMDF
jgi:hypothetical protein